MTGLFETVSAIHQIKSNLSSVCSNQMIKQENSLKNLQSFLDALGDWEHENLCKFKAFLKFERSLKRFPAPLSQQVN